MSSILIKNIGTLVTGKLESPLRRADSIFIKDGLVQAIGNRLNQVADQVIDANGITAIPGLIDSHSHPSIGEYTPAQNSLGWITNYMHGGVTALISAGELHLRWGARSSRRTRARRCPSPSLPRNATTTCGRPALKCMRARCSWSRDWAKRISTRSRRWGSSWSSLYFTTTAYCRTGNRPLRAMGARARHESEDSFRRCLALRRQPGSRVGDHHEA